MSEQHTDGRYYARDGWVHKAPVQHDKQDGSTSFSLGFPVCEMSEYVGEDAAETVALLMNQGAQATHLREVNAALVAVIERAQIWMPEHLDDWHASARAALSRAKGEQV